ncbi:hypothetical protein [Methylosinus sp. RM1]|uniref:hypothetical protein n=1 Tax=Methylosinus sp. RM1 TaxID=2583817 RepID=UPI001409D5AF
MEPTPARHAESGTTYVLRSNSDHVSRPKLKDRFGKPVKPQEWFLVPLPVIDEDVGRIKDQTIVDFEYDAAARLKPIARAPAPSGVERRRPSAKKVSKADRR